MVDALDLGDYEWDRSVLNRPQSAGSVARVVAFQLAITECLKSALDAELAKQIGSVAIRTRGTGPVRVGVVGWC